MPEVGLSAGFKTARSDSAEADLLREWEAFLETYRPNITPANHQLVGLAFRAGWYRGRQDLKRKQT
jgi:hypothetical protein